MKNAYKRRMFIQSLEYICPNCKRKVVGSIKWVLTKSFKGCRACFQSQRMNNNGIVSSNLNQTLGQAAEDVGSDLS